MRSEERGFTLPDAIDAPEACRRALPLTFPSWLLPTMMFWLSTKPQTKSHEFRRKSPNLWGWNNPLLLRSWPSEGFVIGTAKSQRQTPARFGLRCSHLPPWKAVLIGFRVKRMDWPGGLSRGVVSSGQSPSAESQGWHLSPPPALDKSLIPWGSLLYLVSKCLFCHLCLRYVCYIWCCRLA